MTSRSPGDSSCCCPSASTFGTLRKVSREFVREKMSVPLLSSSAAAGPRSRSRVVWEPLDLVLSSELLGYNVLSRSTR